MTLRLILFVWCYWGQGNWLDTPCPCLAVILKQSPKNIRSVSSIWFFFSSAQYGNFVLFAWDRLEIQSKTGGLTVCLPCVFCFKWWQVKINAMLSLPALWSKSRAGAVEPHGCSAIHQDGLMAPKVMREGVSEGGLMEKTSSYHQHLILVMDCLE